MSARTPATAFEWIGEALHLIQDSYSRAHIERAYGTGPGGSHPIRYIRSFHASVFPPSRTRGPREHNFPSDPRDSIRAGGALKSEAVMARNASREYLRMMLRHRARPGAPGNVAELRAFMRKHLSM
jgi:hypothetical protein